MHRDGTPADIEKKGRHICKEANDNVICLSTRVGKRMFAM
jgi:hypothetical protein